MPSLQDYVDDVQELVHDSNQASWTQARIISRINLARLDVARDMHCVRQNVTGVQLLPGQEIYNLSGVPGPFSNANLGGAVAGATVTAGGSGYGLGATVPITFSAPPAGGITALGFGVLDGGTGGTGGALSSITMTSWGQGYTSAPTITVGGAGTGAAAKPVVLFNTLCVLGIAYNWNGERRALKYLEWPLFQSYARMWIQNFNAPPGVFNHYRQSQFVYIQPPPDILYPSEWDVISLPAPLVNLTDNDNQLEDPWCRAVQFKAAEYLLMKHRNWGDVSAYAQKYDSYVPRIIATSGGFRIPNPYNRNFQRRVMR